MLKKYLRNEKRNSDETIRKPTFKIEKRRVRIIIVKEDLFTLLVDAMTEAKYYLVHSEQIYLIFAFSVIVNKYRLRRRKVWKFR